MNQVGKFERVSWEQFKESVESNMDKQLRFASLTNAYDNIKLPSRATSGSAGYDFYTPFIIALTPGQSILIPTGIRCKIDNGWFLACAPRSGLGFKYRLQLDNTLGIIDSDYYYSANEGHIMAKITNDSKEGTVLHLLNGARFMQGIFLPYGITVDEKTETLETRDGGMGSTGQ